LAASLRAGRRRAAVRWNLLGMLDLVVVLGIGALSAPGPLHLVPTVPSTAALLQAPLLVIPVFLAPLSLLLHAASLRAMLTGPEAAVAGAAPTAGPP
jgi:hypothetical protein